MLPQKTSEPRYKKPTTCKRCGHKFIFMTEEDKIQWQHRKMPCPSCNVKYCALPVTEQDLMAIQEGFVLDKTNFLLSRKIYLLLVQYSSSLIKKFHPDIAMDPYEKDFHSHNSVSYMMEEYYKKDNFKIEVSFASFLIHKINQSIYEKLNYTAGSYTKDSKSFPSYSLDYTDSEENKPIVLPDIYDTLDEDFLEEDQTRFLCTHIGAVIDKVSAFCNRKEDFIRILCTYITLKHGERNAYKIFRDYNRIGKEQYLKQMNFIKHELSYAS